MKIQFPGDFHAAQVWERVIGTIKSPLRVDSALFIPNGPMYPEPRGLAILKICARLDGLVEDVALFTTDKKKVDPFEPIPFEIYNPMTYFSKGVVLTLVKNTLESEGFAMPESIVEVELCR